MNLFDQISGDIRVAMLAKDKVRLEALRNAKKYFLEAKTEPGANNVLTDGAAENILRKLVKQGQYSATIYTQKNRPELAEAELAQVAVYQSYLPQPMSAEELEAALRLIIAETGASGMKDMGKVMKEASGKLMSKADSRAISETVRRLLGEIS